MSKLAADTPWNRPETVSGFVSSPPNATLMAFADREQRQRSARRALDIGCGAARNAGPLADAGWHVVGIDTSWPMLEAARQRAASVASGRLQVAQAAADCLPVQDASVDLIVAHGVWNLAASSDEFRAGVREAARVARDGAALFLFTFSRQTLPAGVPPVEGEAFVYTQFSGRPQCFLTREEILSELGACGFSPDPAVPLHELNLPAPGVRASSGPVIFEGSFRFVAR